MNDNCPKCKKETILFEANDDPGDGFIYYKGVCQNCDFEGYQKHEIKFVEWVDKYSN